MRVFQIEVTNHCNEKCWYCPHSKMTRPRGYMSNPLFHKILHSMENKYVGLHHFGEPTLHHLLPNFIEDARNHGIQTEFSTNGYLVDCGKELKAILDERPYLIRYAFDATMSLKFLYQLTTLNTATVIKTHSVNDKTKMFTDFAGQIETEREVTIKGPCFFKIFEYVCVLWDGRIVPCCCDYDGKEVIGDVVHGYKLKSNYDLCKNCKGMQFPDGGLWEAK
jgi:hypothetical protein